MVKNSSSDSDFAPSTLTALSIVEDLRSVARENKKKISLKIKNVRAILDELEEEKKAFGARVEALTSKVESLVSSVIADERARDDAIRDAPFFVGEFEKLSREGRAALAFLNAKFEETCAARYLDVEGEGLRDIRRLRESGGLTDERERLDQIDKAFENLGEALHDFRANWISDTLEQDFAEEIGDAITDERVIDVSDYARELLRDDHDPTVADAIKLDTHDKTREFAEYVAAYDDDDDDDDSD
ncbi:MAG: hypothetical protein CMI16_06845 [Opitutaceae bacterium]|nr:hypothetical protein [Opitutaceae bacterium]|tara:strand:+ start:66 stop:797 length:732 start_codon:yes stop_codon:yes gene_type:complete